MLDTIRATFFLGDRSRTGALAVEATGVCARDVEPMASAIRIGAGDARRLVSAVAPDAIGTCDVGGARSDCSVQYDFVAQ